MSKKNSREAKLLRKEKYAQKRARFNDPCPKPDDYVRHYGYIHNEPYFHNSAIAWDMARLAGVPVSATGKGSLFHCK